MVRRGLHLSGDLFGARGVVRIDQKRHVGCGRYQFMRQFKPFRTKRCVQLSDPGDIAAGVTEVRDEADLNGIAGGGEYHGYGFGRALYRQIGWRVGDDDRDPVVDEISGKRRQAIVVALAPSILDCDIFAFDKAALFQPLAKGRNIGCVLLRGRAVGETDGRYRLLRLPRKGCQGRAAEQRHQLPAPHC